MSEQITSRRGVVYIVEPTDSIVDRFSMLEPITVSVRQGVFSFQDYLSSEQARELGAWLMTVALQQENRERAGRQLQDECASSLASASVVKELFS